MRFSGRRIVSSGTIAVGWRQEGGDAELWETVSCAASGVDREMNRDVEAALRQAVSTQTSEFNPLIRGFKHFKLKPAL